MLHCKIIGVSGLPMELTIEVDDLSRPAIAELLSDHMREMWEVSNPESCHTLALDKLRTPEVTFWSVWSGDELVGCGAIKRLNDTHLELKSMRTKPQYQGKGVGAQLLRHIIAYAEDEGYTRISLETGSSSWFDRACNLYEKFGFTYCEPFGDYTLDPNSLFMTRTLP